MEPKAKAWSVAVTILLASRIAALPFDQLRALSGAERQRGCIFSESALLWSAGSGDDGEKNTVVTF